MGKQRSLAADTTTRLTPQARARQHTNTRTQVSIHARGNRPERSGAEPLSPDPPHARLPL